MYVPKATTYTGFSLECDESLFTTNGGIDLTGGALFIAPTHLSRIYSIALEEITTTAANQLITLYVPIAPCNLSGKLFKDSLSLFPVAAGIEHDPVIFLVAAVRSH